MVVLELLHTVQYACSVPARVNRPVAGLVWLEGLASGFLDVGLRVCSG